MATSSSPPVLGSAGRLTLRFLAVITAGLSAVAAFIGGGLAMLGLCCGAPLVVAGAGTAASAAGASVDGPASWPFPSGLSPFSRQRGCCIGGFRPSLLPGPPAGQVELVIKCVKGSWLLLSSPSDRQART